MAISDDILKTLPPRPYAAVRGEVRTGDLLLVSGEESFSRLIRFGTKSLWSHIAIAVRLESLDRVMVLECVEKHGVRLGPLSTFISQNSEGHRPLPGKVLLARHAEVAAKDDAGLKPMLDYGFGELGDPFSSTEVYKIALRIALGRLNVRLPRMLARDDEFICSEYVGKCYEAIGVRIPWDGLGFLAPSDFAADPHVDAVAQIQAR